MRLVAAFLTDAASTLILRVHEGATRLASELQLPQSGHGDGDKGPCPLPCRAVFPAPTAPPVTADQLVCAAMLAADAVLGSQLDLLFGMHMAVIVTCLCGRVWVLCARVLWGAQTLPAGVERCQPMHRTAAAVPPHSSYSSCDVTSMLGCLAVRVFANALSSGQLAMIPRLPCVNWSSHFTGCMRL
jgi:hypothetical protein